MTEPLLVAILGLAGAAIGFGADWLAHRWPEHEEDYRRGAGDWRTLVLVATGAIAFGALGLRWSDSTLALAVYGVAFTVLIVLLATDLDQKLLPDALTLPLIVFSAAVLLLGWSPALAGKPLGLFSGLAAGIGLPLLLAVSDRILGGDLGLGDIKLSISLGLLFGISQLFYGLLVASIGFAVVLVVLIVMRRITLRTAVPFGPVLIFAAFTAAPLG